MTEQPKRLYFALTNLCNRACELCSCHSDPTRSTHLPFSKFLELVGQGAPYEAQLEGGEPTIHPDFGRMVEHLSRDAHCKKVILCTNAVKVPDVRSGGQVQHAASVQRIQRWLSSFQAKPFVLKPSINSHLIERDKLHIEKMVALLQAFQAMPWTHPAQLLFNVRRRPQPLSADGDQWMVEKLKAVGLYLHCADYAYQRYGKAEDEQALELPFIVANPVPFSLITPDGKDFGTDLIGRAKYMEKLD